MFNERRTGWREVYPYLLLFSFGVAVGWTARGPDWGWERETDWGWESVAIGWEFIAIVVFLPFLILAFAGLVHGGLWLLFEPFARLRARREERQRWRQLVEAVGEEEARKSWWGTPPDEHNGRSERETPEDSQDAVSDLPGPGADSGAGEGATHRMKAPLADALFHVRLEELGTVEPLTAGTVNLAIPPRVGTPAVVKMRYVLYRHAGGLVFDFIKDDSEDLSDAVQMWIWARREVLHAQLVQHAEAFFNAAADAGPEVLDAQFVQQLEAFFTAFYAAEDAGPPEGQ